MSEWKPIETAPKDRDYSPEMPIHCCSGCVTAFDDETGEPLLLLFYRKKAWGAEVTHWSKLPDPPKDAP